MRKWTGMALALVPAIVAAARGQGGDAEGETMATYSAMTYPPGDNTRGMEGCPAGGRAAEPLPRFTSPEVRQMAEGMRSGQQREIEERQGRLRSM